MSLTEYDSLKYRLQEAINKNKLLANERDLYSKYIYQYTSHIERLEQATEEEKKMNLNVREKEAKFNEEKDRFNKVISDLQKKYSQSSILSR